MAKFAIMNETLNLNEAEMITTGTRIYKVRADGIYKEPELGDEWSSAWPYLMLTNKDLVYLGDKIDHDNNLTYRCQYSTDANEEVLKDKKISLVKLRRDVSATFQIEGGRLFTSGSINLQKRLNKFSDVRNLLNTYGGRVNATQFLGYAGGTILLVSVDAREYRYKNKIRFLADLQFSIRIAHNAPVPCLEFQNVAGSDLQYDFRSDGGFKMYTDGSTGTFLNFTAGTTVTDIKTAINATSIATADVIQFGSGQVKNYIRTANGSIPPGQTGYLVYNGGTINWLYGYNEKQDYYELTNIYDTANMNGIF